MFHPRALIFLSLLALLAAGCASGGRRAPALEPLPQVDVAPPPWVVPTSEYPSRRLYQVRFEGPGGKGRFRLAFRFRSPERFQLSATDPLGRSLWTLYVDAGEALLLEHRGKRFCTFASEVDLEQLHLGPFAIRWLPALILGRLPANPASEPRPGSAQVRDDHGRRWRVSATGGRVDGWSLLGSDGAEVARLESAEDDTWRFTDLRDGSWLRWRQTVRETGGGGLERPRVPASYAEGGCRLIAAAAPGGVSASIR